MGCSSKIMNSIIEYQTPGFLQNASVTVKEFSMTLIFPQFGKIQ